MGIPAVANAALAPLLHLADIGIDRLPAGHGALCELGIHSASAAAIEQTNQQSLVIPGLAIGFQLISLQRVLHCYPCLAGDKPGMQTNGYNPFALGQILRGLALLLLCPVIGHDTVDAVKILLG